MDAKSLELVAVEPAVCCGTETCTHTTIFHEDHKGWLVDGKLKCRKGEAEPLFECQLGMDESSKCERVVELNGHVHGPDCGHELVPHGNHHDYLVGSRLHHVVDQEEKCCDRGCMGGVRKWMVLDHGFVNVHSHGRYTKPGRRGDMGSSKSASDAQPLISDIVTTDIFAAGVCCPSEVPIIHRVIEKLPGVESIDVTVVTKNIRIKHDAKKTTPAVLVSALNGAGLQASLGRRGPKQDAIVSTFPKHVVLSGLLLFISLGSFFSSDVNFLKYAALGAVFVGGPVIMIRGIASLRQLYLDINVLMMAATLGAIGLQEYHEAGAMIFLFGLSQWLEYNCMGKARNAVSTLHELQPEFATLVNGTEQIPVEKIEINDIFIVRQGDRVAVDGIVISGSTILDESMLTGESKPISKKIGDSVFSGSVNCGDRSLQIKATSTVSNSTVALLSKKVEDASLSKSTTDRIVEKFAKVYTPLVVLAAILLILISLAVESMEWRHWFFISLVLLVTACPCALVISTPVATICGISSAARQSILIKGGKALETLSQLKGITFDKTGTLTHGHFEVVSVQSYGDNTNEEILKTATSLETHSSHPLASAIVGAAAAKGVHQSHQTFNVETVAGRGLMGAVNGHRGSIGNHQMMLEHQFYFNKPEEALSKEEMYDSEGKKICFVGVDDRVIGHILLADSIRKNAKTALETLHTMHLKLALLTGDALAAAKHIASIVHISEERVFSSLLPEEKSDVLRDLQSSIGKVGHVGDGVNDSVALAAADVGIAMGIGGSTMAVEAADIALFSNDLGSIAKAVEISRRVRRVIYQNILFSISVKMFVLILAILGKVYLWEAVVADVGSSLLVVLNGLRILHHKKQSSPKTGCCKSKKGCYRKLEDINTPVQEIQLQETAKSTHHDHREHHEHHDHHDHHEHHCHHDHHEHHCHHDHHEHHCHHDHDHDDHY